MNIIVTNFTNPFSFFCLLEEKCKDIDIKSIEYGRDVCRKKIDNIDLSHGQYIAVIWKNKWVRGIVSMETQFLIWLIDFGIYIRPNENMFYDDLDRKHKICPSSVFEASIHGVIPVDKVLNSECEIENRLSTTWNKAAIERAKELIKIANKTVFAPIAILSTKRNEVVIGDLHFEINGRSVNLIQELEKWPVFAEKNDNIYIQNLKTIYTSHRRHRACLRKPDLAKTLPNITVDVTYELYKSICDNLLNCEPEKSDDVSSDCEPASEDGDSIVTLSMNICNKGHKLSSTEIKKYANMIIIVAGEEHNALQLLLNKIKDLKMCEQYKNLKSVGRASSRSRGRL